VSILRRRSFETYREGGNVNREETRRPYNPAAIEIEKMLTDEHYFARRHGLCFDMTNNEADADAVLEVSE
jgi:hypothetical protein